MKKELLIIIFGIFGAIFATSASADYVEIGGGGTLLLNRPYCGS